MHGYFAVKGHTVTLDIFNNQIWKTYNSQVDTSMRRLGICITCFNNLATKLTGHPDCIVKILGDGLQRRSFLWIEDSPFVQASQH